MNVDRSLCQNPEPAHCPTPKRRNVVQGGNQSGYHGAYSNDWFYPHKKALNRLCNASSSRIILDKIRDFRGPPDDMNGRAQGTSRNIRSKRGEDRLPNRYRPIETKEGSKRQKETIASSDEDQNGYLRKGQKTKPKRQNQTRNGKAWKRQSQVKAQV
ncbi:hypothetical protein Tco_0009719 [Tanacetum coccineum]